MELQFRTRRIATEKEILMRTFLPGFGLLLALAVPVGADPLRDVSSQTFGPWPPAPAPLAFPSR